MPKYRVWLSRMLAIGEISNVTTIVQADDEEAAKVKAITTTVRVSKGGNWTVGKVELEG